MRWRQYLADLGRALGAALNPATSWDLLARTEDVAQALEAARAAELARLRERRARIRPVVLEMDRPRLNRVLSGIALASDEAERSTPDTEQPPQECQALASRAITRSKRPPDRPRP